VQTYGKTRENIPRRLVILFQHRILQGYQLGCFGQLSVLFLSCFGYEKPGSGHQVIDGGDQSKEYEEYGKDEKGAIEGSGHEHDPDHDQVDSNQGQGDRPMGEATIKEQVMDMVPVGAEWRPAMEDSDAEYPKRIQ
jgi:hypothetical protein